MGGTSLVKATLLLLEEASRGHYQYYHFISGQDLPLRNQNYIHNFFDEHNGQNFISCSDLSLTKHNYRFDYWFPFQNLGGGKTLISRLYNKIIRENCNWLKPKRKRKYPIYGYGSQWFSVTDLFAQYIVSKEKEILKNFKMTLIADESWMQTIYLNSKFVNSKNFRFYSNKKNENIEEIMFDAVRAIDFKRGNPYIYKEGDFDYLIDTGCLFARKFDEKISGSLIDQIVDYIQS